jgi:hypothetical protein
MEEDCGVGTTPIPQTLYVLTDETQGQVISVFCNADYARQYGMWLKRKRPYSQFSIQKTRGNPDPITIHQWH